MGHEVRGEAGSSVSSCVPLSGPKHVPIRAQVTGAASSTTSSSADEEFDPQLSLRSKVTTLGKPKGALAGGAVYSADFRPNVGSRCSGFLRRITFPCI